MLKHPDADKTKGQIVEERDLWKSRYETLRKRYDQEMIDYKAAFERVILEASLQGVKLGTPAAAQVLAKRLEAQQA